MDKEQKASGCESGDKMQVLKGSGIIPSSIAHVQVICRNAIKIVAVSGGHLCIFFHR